MQVKQAASCANSCVHHLVSSPRCGTCLGDSLQGRHTAAAAAPHCSASSSTGIRPCAQRQGHHTLSGLHVTCSQSFWHCTNHVSHQPLCVVCSHLLLRLLLRLVPGGMHHAKKAEASGFCYINDIVLGILELLKVRKLRGGLPAGGTCAHLLVWHPCMLHV